MDKLSRLSQSAIVLIPRRRIQELNVRIWVCLLFSGHCGGIGAYVEEEVNFACEKHCDDRKLEASCRSFLPVVENAFRREKLKEVAHHEIRSETLDLIARIWVYGTDLMQSAWCLRKKLDDAHATPVLDQISDSEFFGHLLQPFFAGDGCNWGDLNWWLSIHEHLEDRMEICDSVIHDCIQGRDEYEEGRRAYVYLPEHEALLC